MNYLKNLYDDRLAWATANPEAAQVVSADLAFAASVLLLLATLAYVFQTARANGILRKQQKLSITPLLRLSLVDGEAHLVNLSPSYVWIETLTTRLTHSPQILPSMPASRGLQSGETTRVGKNLHFKYQVKKGIADARGETRRTSLMVDVDFYHAPSGNRRFKMRYSVNPDTGEQVVSTR